MSSGTLFDSRKSPGPTAAPPVQSSLTNVQVGAEVPEGVIFAGVGSLYLQTTTGALWHKVSGSGNTGWRRTDFGNAADPFPGLMGPVFNVKAFGAVMNGITNDVVSAQAAEAAARAVKGTLYVPSGDLLIGSTGLLIGSGVTLYLAAGARIIRGYTGGNPVVLNADQTNGNTDITICGDGQFVTLSGSFTGSHMQFTKCNRVKLRDFQCRGVFSGWNVTLLDSNDVQIDDLFMDSGTATTEDGIHIAGGSRIKINGCDITSGDDCIALLQEGSTGTTDITDVTISNCYLNSRTATALKIQCSTGQTPSNRAIRRVVVSDVVAKSVSAGWVVRDLTNTGIVTDITIDDLTLDGSAMTTNHEVDGARRVMLRDIKVISPWGALLLNRFTDVELCGYETTGTRTSGQPGVWAASAAGTCTNLKVLGGHFEGAQGAAGDGLTIGDASAVVDPILIGLTVVGNGGNGIHMKNTSGGSVSKCRCKSNTDRGIRVGALSSTVRLEDNDCRGNTGGAIFDAGTATYRNRNRINSGTGPMSGQAVLVNGTVTVSTGEVLSGENIHLTRIVGAGTTRGLLSVGTIVTSTSFVINSTDLAGTLSADDDSTVFWEIVH